MKKLLLIFSICCFGWQYNAFAECQLLSCDSFSWYEPNGWLRAGVDSNQCYGCGLGPRSCGNGDVVPYLDTNGEILDIYQCTYGLTYSFENANPGILCSDSPIKSTTATNSKTIYKPVGSKTTSFSVGDFTVFSGTAFCKYIYCLDGYTPSPDKTKCVNNSKRCSTKFGTIAIGFAYAGVATKKDCTDSGAKILEPKGLEFEMLCRPGPTLVCKATKCPDRYKPNRSTGKCDPTDNNNNGGGGGGTGTNSCEQTRCGGLSGSKYNECVACCHVASSVANWNDDSCVCAQLPDQMKFVPNTNPKTGGVCLKSNDGLSEEDKDKLLEPIELYKCDPAKIAQVFTWQTQYANNSQISAQITAILAYCDDIHRTELQFNSMYNQLQILINNANDAAELNQRQTSSRRNIERAMSDIDSIRSTLDQSKWKNADGGFNTSRLLSDSIAGVVLGTASGLIVSHVVKKNQVENGFEDIQCTVGGQVVANWGDEFQVGIQ